MPILSNHVPDLHGTAATSHRGRANLYRAFCVLAATLTGLMAPHLLTLSSAARAQGDVAPDPVHVSNSDEKCAALVGLHFGPSIVREAKIVAPSGAKPEYCEVLAYQAGKPIHMMRAFLPTEWHGGMVHAGTGAFKGVLKPEEALWNASAPTEQGMVYISGNGGHDDPSGLKLYEPENMRDYVYRNIGTVYDFGKAVVAAYYGEDPAQSIFIGCSAGGQEGYQAASIYPQNYDGIISQAGPPDRVGWIARMAPLNVLKPLSITQWVDIYQGYIAQCDAIDGAVDGIVSNPGACRYDPRTLRAWTPEELETIDFVYSPVLAPDGEILIEQTGFGLSRFVVMERYSDIWGKTLFARDEPNYDPRNFTLERYLPQMRDAANQYGFNLDPVAIAGYLKQGGRLLIQHGLDDGGVSPFTTKRFAEQIGEAAGSARDNLQVQFAPGVGHCGNRMPPVPDTGNDATVEYLRQWSATTNDDVLSGMLPGADQIESIGYMKNWVDNGSPPQTLIATRFSADGSVALTRPVCLSGSYPRYDGSGDMNLAGNFTCVADPAAL